MFTIRNIKLFPYPFHFALEKILVLWFVSEVNGSRENPERETSKKWVKLKFMRTHSMI